MKTIKNECIVKFQRILDGIYIADEWVEVERVEGNQVMSRVGFIPGREDRLAFQLSEIAKHCGTSVLDVGILLDRLKHHVKGPAVITGNVVRCEHTWEDFAHTRRCSNCGEYAEPPTETRPKEV